MSMTFVVGNSRSGTTMLGRILGRNPEVFTFHELHFFEQLWNPCVPAPGLSAKNAIDLTAELLAIQRDGYLSKRQPGNYQIEAENLIGKDDQTAAEVFQHTLEYESGRHGKVMSCDQTPRNVFYIDELLQLYPDCRVIVMVRDPRDVCLSQKNKWRRRFLGANNIPVSEAMRAWLNYHPQTISMLWNAAIKAGLKFDAHPRVRHVRFEDLVASPHQITHDLCEFLNLSYDENMLEVPQIGSSEGRDSSSRLGISRDAIGRWKRGGLSAAELALCDQITSKCAKRFDYPPAEASGATLGQLAYRVTWPVKTGLALLFNLKRASNIVQTIRKRLNA